MPARQLTHAEHQLVVRCIMDAQHMLAVRNGGTFVEVGTAPQDADETTSAVIDDRDLIAELELALAALGHRPGDPTPPRTIEQLQSALKLDQG